VSAIFLLIVLMRLRRMVRYDGFLTLVFGAWYGTGRFMEDFFRIDVTHGTGLTGSQWTALTVLGLCLYCLVVLKDTPWRSGKGDFASIPRRHRVEEPPVPEVEEDVGDDAAQPVVDADQPKEDAE
jgi:hypothetical protein